MVPAPVNISVKRLKLRLSGSARKSQKRFRDTPTFKIQAVLARTQPFQRSNERLERGDHPVRLSGSHTNIDRSRYPLDQPLGLRARAAAGGSDVRPSGGVWCADARAVGDGRRPDLRHHVPECLCERDHHQPAAAAGGCFISGTFCL